MWASEQCHCTDEGFDFPTLKQVKAVYPEAKFDLNAGA